MPKPKVPKYLKPYEPNRKCPNCRKEFYVNERTQAGKPQIYCSVKCRAATYYKIKIETINKLTKENEELKKKLRGE